MKLSRAILLTFLVFLVLSLVGYFLDDKAVALDAFVVGALSAWVAVDSHQIRFSRYKSAIAFKPIELFIFCALFSLIAFPWYLAVRYRIKQGCAPVNFKEMRLPGD